MEFDWEDDREKSKKGFNLLPSYHLASPLRNDGLWKAYHGVKTGLKDTHRYDKMTEEGKVLTDSIPCKLNLLDPQSRSTPFSITFLINLLFNNIIECNQFSSSFSYFDAWDTIKHHWEVQRKICYGSSISIIMPSFFPLYWRNLRVLESILSVSSQDDYPSKREGFLRWGALGLNRVYVITGKLISIVVRDQDSWFLSRDGLLLLIDILHQRYMSLILSDIASQIHLKNFPSKKTLIGLFSKGDELILINPSKAMDVLKHFEGLVIGNILSSSDEKVTDPNEFLNLTIKSILKETEDPKVPSLFKNKVDNFLHFIATQKPYPEILSQLFGLYRIWGHPEINAVDGCLKLRELSCSFKNIDYETVNKVTCKFKEILCINYRTKYGKWPNLNTDLLPQCDYLKHCIENNIPLDKKSPNYYSERWSFVSGKTTFECESTFNLTSVIGDKALSLNHKELVDQISRFKNIGRPSERRVLVEWLKSNLISAKDFLDDINNKGLDIIYKIIGVCPKEREMKKIPRLFSLLTLPMRMFFVLTEYLLAKFVLPLFPQITMIDDELTLMKKTYSAIKNLKPKSTDDKIDVVINIDFEKWNSNMRGESVNPIFKFIDELFGYSNVFQRTHEFFEESTIYLADSSILPEVENGKLKSSPTCWSGHKGGFEGLRQKGWTLHTTSALELVAEGLPVKINVMGQGDNQTVILSIIKPNDAIEPFDMFAYSSEIVTRFKNKMRNIFTGLGLPIKEFETWSSSCVFAYGKRLYYNGVQLPMSLKKLGRLFSFNNEGLPLFSSSISTIFANGAAGCLSDNLIDISYLACIISAVKCIDTHLSYPPLLGKTSSKKMTTRSWNSNDKLNRRIQWNLKYSYKDLITSKRKETVRKLLLFPGSFGGLPVQSMVSFMTRGFPDPLTLETAMLLQIVRKFPNYEKEIFSWISPNCCGQRNQIDIIESPLSLNIIRPALPDIVIKKECGESLKTSSWVTNPYIRSFLDLGLDDPSAYKDMLLHVKPMWPRLTQEIYSATLWGYVQSILGRVENSRTFQSIVSVNSSGNILTKIKNLEENYFKGTVFLCWKENKNSLISGTIYCSREIADSLRFSSWGLGTLEGVTTPHPIEMVEISSVLLTGCNYPNCNSLDDEGYVLLKVDDSLRLDPQKCLSTIGPAIPYLGSFTQEKVSNHEDKTLVNKESLTKRAIALERTINWFISQNSLLAFVIHDVLKAISDIDPLLLISDLDNVTGSEDHRYHDERTTHGGFVSIMYNMFTYIHMSTDPLTKYSKGGKNYTIHFQALLCWIETIVGTKAVLSVEFGHPLSCYHAHIGCKTCIKSVGEEQIDLYPENLIPLPPSCPDNPFCWVKMETLIKKSSVIDRPLKKKKINCDEYYDVAHRSVSILIAELIIQKMSQYQGNVGVSPTVKQVPLVWFLHLNPYILLKNTYSFIMCFFLFSVVNEYKSSDSAFEKAKKMLELFPPFVYEPLIGIFHFQETRQVLLTNMKSADCPKAVPYTTRACCIAMRDNIIKIGDDISKSVFCDIINVDYVFPVVHRGLSSTFLCILNEFFSINVRKGDKILTKIKNIHIPLNVEWYNVYNYPPLMSDILLQQELNVTTLQKNIIKSLRSINQVMNSSVEFVVKSIPKLGLIPMETVHVYWPTYQTLRTLLSYRSYHERATYVIFPRVDPIVRVSPIGMYKRPVSICTTAFYKYLGIFLKHEDEIMATSTAACVGDGTGGVTALLLSMNPNVKVVYNSLIELNDILPHSLGSFIPPALEILGISTDRLIGFPLSVQGITDITDPYFHIFIHSLSSTLDTIICDAEGGGWNHPKKGLMLSISLANLAIISKTRLLILKTYLSNVIMVSAQISIMSDAYHNVTLCHSDFSGDLSTECFIICKKLKEYPIKNELQENVFCSITSNIMGNTLTNLLEEKRASMETVVKDISKEVVRDYSSTFGSIFGIDRSILRESYSLVPKTRELYALTANIKEKISPLFIGVKWEKSRFCPGFCSESRALQIVYSFIDLAEIRLWGNEDMERLDKHIRSPWCLKFFPTNNKLSWGVVWMISDDGPGCVPIARDSSNSNLRRFYQAIGSLSLESDDFFGNTTISYSQKKSKHNTSQLAVYGEPQDKSLWRRIKETKIKLKT